MKKQNQTLALAVLSILVAAPSALAATDGGSSVSSRLSGGSHDSDSPESRLINLRVAPLAIAVGGMGAHLDFGVADGITVGPTFSYQTNRESIGDFYENKVAIYELGVRANFYLNGRRYSDGFLIGPYVSFMPASVTEKSDGVESTGSVSGLSAGALASYQWVWKNGLNLTAGAGLAYYSLPETATVAQAGGAGASQVAVPSFTGLLPNVELTMGYVF